MTERKCPNRERVPLECRQVNPQRQPILFNLNLPNNSLKSPSPQGPAHPHAHTPFPMTHLWLCSPLQTRKALVCDPTTQRRRSLLFLSIRHKEHYRLSDRQIAPSPPLALKTHPLLWADLPSLLRPRSAYQLPTFLQIPMQRTPNVRSHRLLEHKLSIPIFCVSSNSNHMIENADRKCAMKDPSQRVAILQLQDYHRRRT